MWYWHYHWLGASYIYDKTTTTKKCRFFWEFSKMPIFEKMIFYQKFDQDDSDFRSPPTRCQLQSFLWKFTKKCNSASSVDSAHRQILSHARSSKTAWHSPKYFRKKSLQISVTCSKSKKHNIYFFYNVPVSKKNKNGRRRRRRPLGPKTAPQAEKKKIQAFGGPKS